MLIALGSVKASPGVSTFALALAAHWPAVDRPVMVECDPAGGDLAARFSLSITPGLIGLAAAARGSVEPEVILEHAQRLRPDLPVVPGPVRPEQARAALHTLLDDGVQSVLLSVAGRTDLTVIADCGRLDHDSPALRVIAAADHALLLTRPRADELSHIASRLTELQALCQRLSLLLVGPGYSAAEVSAELGVPVLGYVPMDAVTAARLGGPVAAAGVVPGWPRRRRGLPRAAAQIAQALAGTSHTAELVEAAPSDACTNSLLSTSVVGAEPASELSTTPSDSAAHIARSGR
jgi:hypothetical protein